MPSVLFFCPAAALLTDRPSLQNAQQKWDSLQISDNSLALLMGMGFTNPEVRQVQVVQVFC